MSSNLQLDVGHNNQRRRHLVNACKAEAGMVSFAGKMCDQYLGALKIR